MISGKEVRIAPGTKRIPAAEFSTLLSVASILEEIEKERAEFKAQGEKEIEEAKKEAEEKGFQAGLDSLNKHLFSLNQELQQLRDDIQKKILPLALSAARKVLGVELKLHPERIVDIILTSLKSVTQHKKIKIYVNKGDLAMLEEQRPKMKAIFEHLESLTIQERSDIEPGGCIIETEAGIINAQLENQWRALESAFAAYKP